MQMLRFLFQNALVLLKQIVLAVVSLGISLGLLWLLFQISPNEAHIQYDATEVSAIMDLEAESAMGTIATHGFEIFDFQQLHIDPPRDNNITYYIGSDVIKADELDYFLISPLDDNQEAKLIYKMDDEQLSYLYFTTMNPIEAVESKFWIEYLSSDFSLLFENGFFAYFKTDDNEGVLYDVDKLLIPSTNEIVNLPTPCYEVEFENCKVIGVLKDGRTFISTSIECNEDIYLSVSDMLSIVGGFRMRPTKHVDGNITWNWDYSLIDVDILMIKRLLSNGSGNLEFVYTREPTHYTLYNQTLLVTNSENELTMHIDEFKWAASYRVDEFLDYSNNKYTLLGSVKKGDAYICKLSLFPDMSSWFRENAFLAPVTLITTLLGVFGMNFKWKKFKPEKQPEMPEDYYQNINKALVKLQNIDFADEKYSYSHISKRTRKRKRR